MVNGLNKVDLKEFLDEKYQEYNNVNFIEQDPIQIPHLYTEKKDIEIAGFLTSIISWGNRKSIINSAHKMMDIMDNSPYEFVINSNNSEINKIQFVHRTFNSKDLCFFIKSLYNIYKNKGGLEYVFNTNKEGDKQNSSRLSIMGNFQKIDTSEYERCEERFFKFLPERSLTSPKSKVS